MLASVVTCEKGREGGRRGRREGGREEREAGGREGEGVGEGVRMGERELSCC